MEANCRLCGSPAALQESHIIPAFVFRWRKDTSPTPFMRSSAEPERRVQDGLKQYWLCRNCEQVLGNWERQFASTIFHPITKNGSHRISYSDRLLKFCVSISWRGLLLAKDKTSFTDFTDAERLAAEGALRVWREFLCGRAPHPGPFEQHLLLFEDVASYGGSPLPANMNRYALRSIEMDVGRARDFCFTFVKMGPFAILGFFHLANPRAWKGGKVHVKYGVVGGPTRYSLPVTFFEYLVGRARKYGATMEYLSDEQRAIADKATEAALAKNMDKLADSHWMKAMQRDFDQFGDDAFKVGWPGSGDDAA
jgi:hypothetical protein